MIKKKKISNNIQHQKDAIEIFGILLASENYLSADQIIRKYSDIRPDSDLNEKKIRRCLDTVSSVLRLQTVESNKRKGYRVKPEFRKNFFWMLPLLSLYLIYNLPDSMDFVLEPIVFQLRAESLKNLFLLSLAVKEKKIIRFEYTKYSETKSAAKKVHPYKLVQRDKKLHLLAFDPSAKKMKHYFFSGIGRIQVLESEFEPIHSGEAETYYEDMISNFRSDIKKNAEIHFSKESASFIHKDYFHRNQSISENPDGSFTLSVQAANPRDIYHIVSQYMNYTELIAPAEWREEYRKNLENHLKIHRRDTE
ncbi:MAG TPA: WYL domain-containing protein [Leptospiraceae bacterium]|nr:WYL domain-containing protein [Leptospiraceae bacterium]HNI98541.1 WYL domain-containing protein [Leptospiraceae bacterium]HNN07102.1 WYL domain-containing protein [Leptospiraceae bacterium]HNO25277.1 WYL domain-containing protein [Leptospiraceae bacterium]